MSSPADDAAVSVKIAALARDITDRLPGRGDEALQELVEGAVTLISGADYASVTVVTRRTGAVRTVAATGRYPRLLDAVQHAHQQGPSFAVAADRESCCVCDLAADERWPGFAPAVVAQTPIRSVMTFELFSTRETGGTITFCAVGVDVFDQHARDLGFIVAAHAAIIWSAVQRTAEFRGALARRDTIGQAKGMLMERYGLDADGAFGLLRTLSQEQNIRLHEVARRLVAADHPAPK